MSAWGRRTPQGHSGPPGEARASASRPASCSLPPAPEPGPLQGGPTLPEARAPRLSLHPPQQPLPKAPTKGYWTRLVPGKVAGWNAK